MIGWLRNLFLPSRIYRVFRWEKGWQPGGKVRATSWAHARRLAAKKHRGYQTMIQEE